MIRSLFRRVAAGPEERRINAWCRKTLGLTPSDPALYRQALRHSSAVPEDRPDLPNNERLEFLGDAVLDAIIGQLLFRTYADKGEGFLTRMRSKLVSRHQLNILAKKIEIERVVESNVSKGHETSVPGNALEALIGAIFLDKGFERTRKLVLGLMEKHFDLKTIEAEDRDAKSRLLEWGQKKRKKVEYIIREEHARGRGRNYLCEVRIDGQVRGSGHGHSKKHAEQEASQAAFNGMQHEGRAKHDRPGGERLHRDHGRRRGRGQHRPDQGRPPRPKGGDGGSPIKPGPAAGDGPADDQRPA